VPGYHLHFISADRTRGGHLLQCRGKNLRLQIQREGDYHISCRQTTTGFGAADTDAIADAAGLINKARNPVLMLGLLASEKDAAE
jgi:alpha-acetolactate decarboxylase